MRAFSITEAREADRRRKLPDRALKVVVLVAAVVAVEAISVEGVAAVASAAAVDLAAADQWSSSSPPRDVPR